jgi:hypothetical protein
MFAGLNVDSLSQKWPEYKCVNISNAESVCNVCIVVRICNVCSVVRVGDVCSDMCEL